MFQRVSWTRGRAVSVCVLALSLLLTSTCSDNPVTTQNQLPNVEVPRPQFLSSAFNGFDFLGFVKDDQGANDTPAQSDLNAFTRADNVTGFIAVKWVWDDINSWTGSGQTGDACALFDTDNPTDGKADAAVCVRISNPNGDPTVTTQLPSPASPLMYSCGDNKADRCAQPANPASLGATVCEVEKLAGETFFTAGEDGADILAACKIPLSAIPNNPDAVTPNLLNVCSFPSGSPNSNPFDCVVTPGAGFLIIKKATTPQSSGKTFSFTINPAVVAGATQSITDNSASDEQTALLSATPGTYSVTEGTPLPTGWVLDAAACAKQTTPPTATGTKSGNAVTGVSVTSGETTVCTFSNSVTAPSISIVKTAGSATVAETGGSITYTVTVTNNSTIDVSLTSLIDDKFGDLDGKGTCNSASNPTNPYPTALAANGTYTCTFPGTLAAAAPSTVHVNEVTASANSTGGTATAKDTAKVTYTDALPDITVTKEADDSSFQAVGGTSVGGGFTPDQEFLTGSGGGGGSTPVFGGSTCDDAGANDTPDQTDLNCFSRADNVAGRLWLRWTWDAISGFGGGQTGDGCALLDTDNNSKANFAFCVRITNPTAGTVGQLTPGSPVLYKCKDLTNNPGEIDRCASKTLIQQLDASSVCTITKVADGIVGGEEGQDTQAECDIKLADLGQNITIDLLNVCSFPSGSPNSNPFDCVVTPQAGFLVITKSTTPTSSTAVFGYRLRNSTNTANATSTNGYDEFGVKSGVTSAAIPMLPGTYAIEELMPTGWSLNTISCTRDGNSVGSLITGTTVQGGVTIVQGQTTTCTFANTLTASQTITFYVKVTNNSLEAVNLFSLEDSENPDAGTPTYATLSGVGTCNATGNLFGSIAGNGGTYTCSFTRVVSGPPGTTHKDRVRAVGKDNETNSDTETSTIVTISITP
jgi:hypothetical protein